MRYQIFQLLENKEETLSGKVYNLFMMLTITISLIPLMDKHPSRYYMLIELWTSGIFVVDYLLRLTTADYKLNKGYRSFFLYPFTFLALTDLFSIFPSLFLWNNSLKLFKIIRMARLLRVFRIVRHSKNIHILTNVLRKQKDSLLIVCVLAIGYIFLSALLLFNIESETFPTFFDALYWATISLTTVGYGDIFATSLLGKLLTMISSIIGIAIVALPAGIITAGYLEEIQSHQK